MGCSYCPIFFEMYVIHILVVQKRENIYGYMIKTVNNFNKENQIRKIIGSFLYTINSKRA